MVCYIYNMSDVNDHRKFKNPQPHYMGLLRGVVNCEHCGQKLRVRVTVLANK